MRKSLLLVTLLASLLLSTAVVSAQSMSLIGGLGLGSLSEFTATSDFDFDSGLAFQGGAVYDLTNNFGIGALYDRTSGSVSSGTSTIGVTLSGFNAILQVNMPSSGAGLGAFGGVGIYDYTMRVSSPGYFPYRLKTKSALGFIFGAQAKYPLSPDLHLTGTAAYRSAKFTEATENGIDYYPLVTEFIAHGWSFGGGVGFSF